MRLFTLVIALILGIVGRLPAVANDEPPGKIVLAKVTGDAVALYDASSEVAKFVRDGTDDHEADRRLEADALSALAKVAPDVSAAKTITIRITYARTGDVSPVYGSPTFAGIERYANLHCAIADARADKSGWQQRTATFVPAWVTFEIVGKLPPKA